MVDKEKTIIACGPDHDINITCLVKCGSPEVDLLYDSRFDISKTNENGFERLINQKFIKTSYSDDFKVAIDIVESAKDFPVLKLYIACSDENNQAFAEPVIGSYRSAMCLTEMKRDVSIHTIKGSFPFEFNKFKMPRNPYGLTPEAVSTLSKINVGDRFDYREKIPGQNILTMRKFVKFKKYQNRGYKIVNEMSMEAILIGKISQYSIN